MNQSNHLLGETHSSATRSRRNYPHTRRAHLVLSQFLSALPSSALSELTYLDLFTIDDLNRKRELLIRKTLLLKERFQPLGNELSANRGMHMEIQSNKVDIYSYQLF